MASGFIFPVTVHGQLSDVYGKAVTQYANTLGVPGGSGLQQGMFGVLFDGTMCRLLNAVGGVNPFDAVTYQSGNSNDYSVQQVTAVQQFVMGINDRAGSTPLVANNLAWFTTRGVATANVLANQTAPMQLASSSQAGYLGGFTPGTTNLSTGVISGNSVQTNLSLLNTTTSQGAYPVRLG